MNASKHAIRFFQDHAGYATPPGKMTCAWLLAQAEYLGDSLGWEVEWVEDQDSDLSWCECWNNSKIDHSHEVLGAVLKDRRGMVLESLWGITDADRSYRRVVEAELKSQAIG